MAALQHRLHGRSARSLQRVSQPVEKGSGQAQHLEPSLHQVAIRQHPYRILARSDDKLGICSNARDKVNAWYRSMSTIANLTTMYIAASAANWLHDASRTLGMLIRHSLTALACLISTLCRRAKDHACVKRLACAILP